MEPIVATSRVDTVRGRLGEFGVDALIVSSLTNVAWLTGFGGSSGIVLVTGDELVLVTDGRYGEQAERQIDAAGVRARVVVARSAAETGAALTAAIPPAGRVGFESAHVSHQTYVRWEAELTGRLAPTVGVVERARRRKDRAELARIARAAAIADRALADTVASLSAGVTETEVRNALEHAMRELGAAGPSYETIVATGPADAALPHHRPTSTRLENGHTVVIDVGALVEGYHSDMTRTFVIGEPSPLQQQVYDTVLRAQAAGLAAVRPGAHATAIDAACRDMITEAGFGPWFLHGTGHGVGLEIHEEPYLGPTATGVLEVGDVVTVEPGVYRGDFGGVRIEDLVEVTATGYRLLTQSPKDAPCLPSAPTT